MGYLVLNVVTASAALAVHAYQPKYQHPTGLLEVRYVLHVELQYCRISKDSLKSRSWSPLTRPCDQITSIFSA